MKTFKELINEVQEPLSQGEQNFKGLHNPINHKNIVPGVTDQDHVFNGSMQRKDPKTASYEDNASEQAYDQTLKIKNSEEKKKGTQTDLNMEEEAELVDEAGTQNWDSAHRHGLRNTLHNRMLTKKAMPRLGPSKAQMKADTDAAYKAELKKRGMKEETIEEKHLTPAEMKKREEIAKAIARENPKMPMGKKMAIATATAKKVAEEVEHLDEISKKTAYAAYAYRANDDYSKDYGDKLHGMITKKWGKKAGDDAEAHASAQHFGRGGKSSGTDRLKGIWNTAASSMRTTKSGKINKQDTKAKGNEIKSRLGSHTKAKLPEELELDEAYKNPDKHYATLSQKQKDAVNTHLRQGKSYWEAVRAVKKIQKEDLELDEARRGRPRKDGSKPEGDEEGGREHIIVQLRKVVNLRGQKHVEFNDNSKHQVEVDHAKKALSMHDNMKRAEDKQNFANQLAKSHSSFKSALAGNIEKPAKKGISLAKLREAVTRNSQNIDPEQGDADSTTMRSDRGAYKTYTTVGADGRMKLVKHREHSKEVKIGESKEMNPKNAQKMIKHDCAKHVLHKEWGEGETVEGMHSIVETTEGEGYVTHYDVMFEHGIEQNVPVEDLEIVTMVEHWHKNYKPKNKMGEGKEHTVPKTAKEKDLAALAEPKDKITHKDVLVGRGVVKKGVKEALEMSTKSVKDAASTQTKTSQPSDENMQQDSLNKMKTDPLSCKDTGKPVPPTQGNKAIGGEGEPSRVGGKYSVEESADSLNNLYNSLSNENREMFDALLESSEGVEQLIQFAKEQGF